jgi:hypothetical protein
MGELTNQVSNGPDSFFDSRAVDLRGCCNGPMWSIRCGRGVGRNGRVSWDDFQLNSLRIKNQNFHNTTTNLSFEGASSTPRCRKCWEDNEPTRRSKLHKLTEIEGDDGPVQQRSHHLVLLWGSAKMGARGHLLDDSRTSPHKYACIVW